MTKSALVKAEEVHQKTKDHAKEILSAHEKMDPAICYISWAFKEFVDFMAVVNDKEWWMTDKWFVYEASRFNRKRDEKLM